MKTEFPYEEYKATIEEETKVRNAGVDAEVISIESDETLPGGYLLNVKLLGKFEESLYEGGTVSVGGCIAGHIVDVNAATGDFVVMLKAEKTPVAGEHVVFTPPDYLQALREFSAEVLEKPEKRNEERFIGLRDEMLGKTVGAGIQVPALPNLRNAQNLALHGAMRRGVSMLWGPPGTGKSYTLGHIAEMFRTKGKRVLVLSTTNAAVDVTTFSIDDACRRAGRPLADAELIRRASSLTQIEEYEARPHLMSFTKLLKKFMKEQRALEAKLKDARHKLADALENSAERTKAMLTAANLVGELRDLGERRKEELAELVGQARIVTSSITACLFNDLLVQDFDVVLIDEASQVPLAVWPLIFNKANGKKFVVAGDPMQLEPVSSRSKSISAGFWFGQSLYCYLGMTSFAGISGFCKSGSMVLLDKQTRMRKGICNVVSKMFYDGRLSGDRDVPKMDFAAAGLPEDDVVVVDSCKGGEICGFDRVYDYGMRNTNCESAGRVLEMIRKLANTNTEGRQLDILVVTPFRNQAKIYSSKFRAMKVGDNITVRASTVHGAQGDEADVVFFDLVDPANAFLTRKDAAHLWCVACSRAREKLVLVGDKTKMAVSPFAAKLMNIKNG